MSEKRRDNRNRILRGVSTSAQMGGIGSVILMRTEKRKMFTVGVWIKMTLHQKAENENLR